MPNNAYNFNNRNTLSTIDRQLEMFENVLNQASEASYIDQDCLMTNRLMTNGAQLHRSNLSLADQNHFVPHKINLHRANDSFDTNIYANIENNVAHDRLQYLKMIGRNGNSICANNSNNIKEPKPAQRLSKKQQLKDSNDHFWTPLNDLSSESDDYDYNDSIVSTGDDEVNCLSSQCQSISDECDHYVDNIVDIEVEDFIDGHQYQAPMSKCKHRSPKLASIINSDDDQGMMIGNYSQKAQKPRKVDRASKLPTEPCFTLSNQLKTLLHNSNRLKSQNYFFY